MNKEDGFSSRDFFANKVIDQIFATKKRMDRLLFLLILVSAIGIIYPNDPPSSLSFVVSKLSPSSYHAGIVFSLLGIFTMIGSVLIDYVVKRKKIDNFFIDDEFVIANYKTEYIIFDEASNIEAAEKNKLYYISRTLVPSSFYEFLYTLHITTKHLRLISVVVLMTIFMISHVVCCMHALEILEGWMQFAGICIILLINIVLYAGVINSMKKYHPAIWKLIFQISVVSAIPAVVYIIYIAMHQ